jgi:hypothetical protein
MDSDFNSRARAQRLADRITDFWAARGYHVRCWIASEYWRNGDSDDARESIIPCVRSDMVNGHPIRRMMNGETR